MWASVAVILATSIATFVYARSQNNSSYRSDIRSCERGNLIRERLNLIGIEIGLHLEPLPIIDCPAIVR